jgi:MFS family permease
LYGVSALAVIGGAMMTLVPRGPYRKPGFRLEPAAAWRVFRNKELRAAAFGYFGHMWELYAFWAFVPFAIVSYGENNQAWTGQTALLSFLFIGIGGPACIAGGYLSGRFGAGNTARAALLLSGICCLSYPLIYWYASPAAFIAFMLCWGAAVIADSPMFSTLVARTASPSSRGTALTIVNCIGFAITILSIQWLQYLSDLVPAAWLFVFLAPGPAFGLLAMRFLPARPAKK